MPVLVGKIVTRLFQLSKFKLVASKPITPFTVFNFFKLSSQSHFKSKVIFHVTITFCSKNDNICFYVRFIWPFRLKMLRNNFLACARVRSLARLDSVPARILIVGVQIFRPTFKPKNCSTKIKAKMLKELKIQLKIFFWNTDKHFSAQILKECIVNTPKVACAY